VKKSSVKTRLNIGVLSITRGSMKEENPFPGYCGKINDEFDWPANWNLLLKLYGPKVFSL